MRATITNSCVGSGQMDNKSIVVSVVSWTE